jgi:di/tricarboxylate transporter
MFNIIIESIVAGIITLIIGTIIFNLTINKQNKNQEKPDSINISFFMTGLVMNFLLSFSGFNKWYCDKECMQNCSINK